MPRPCVLLLLFAVSLAAAPATAQPVDLLTFVLDQAPPAQPNQQAPPRQPAPPGQPGQPRQGDAPPPPQPPLDPRPPMRGQPVNLRIEMTISDQRAGAEPIKKTVSMLVADQGSGMIRAESHVQGAGEVPLHVDASPVLVDGGKIRLRLTFAYDLPGTPPTGGEAAMGKPWKTALRENLTLIVEDGKPLVVSQSADPISDRRVVVEVRVTVQK